MEQMKAPAIFKAKVEAMKLMKDGVSKAGYNQVQKFKFRSIDDVYNAVFPALCAAGISIGIKSIERIVTPVIKDGKSAGNNVCLHVQYELTSADDASCEVSDIWGQAIDYQDKATSKAYAIAFKYFIFQAFCLPTEQMQLIDPDLHSPMIEQMHKDAEKAKEKPVEKPAAPLAARVNKAAAPSAKPPVKAAEGLNRAQMFKDALVQIGTDSNGVMEMRAALIKGGVIPDKSSKDMTDEEYTAYIKALVDNFKGDKNND